MRFSTFSRVALAVLLLALPAASFAQDAGGLPANVLRIVTPITVGDCLQVSKATVPYAAGDTGAPCGTGGGGSGTVSSFSFVNGAGINGTVLNATTTPSLSLSPAFTGFAYSNGTSFSAASTTGSGNLVLANSPTLVTPALGTPSAIDLLNGVGLPFSGLTTGTLGSGILTIGTGASLTYAGSGVLNANQIGSLAWPAPIAGDCLTTSGTALLWGTCGGAGTSFQVNGTATAASNPIDFLDSALTDGLTLSFANPSAGEVQLGLTGTLSTAGGGTGLSALTEYSLLSGGATTANLIAPSATAGEALVSNGAAAQPGYAAALAGVTSVNGTTIPAAATLLYSGSALGTPSAGTLTNATGLPLSTGVTGILGIGNGGSGLSGTPTNGELLIGNGSGYALGAVQGSTNVTVTDGPGSIALALPTTITANTSGTAATATALAAAPTQCAGAVATGIAASGNANCTPTPTLGASGTLGSVTLGNATSGTVTVEPVTGALGAVTASLPANTGTVGETNLAQTWTAAQTFGTDISIGGVTPSGATGTGALVFGTSPSLTTPALGTPSAVTLTNATGLPLTTGVAGILPAANGGTGDSTGLAAGLSGSPTTGQFWGYNGTTQGWATPTGSGTVNSGTAGQLGYYSATGTVLSGLNLGAGLAISSGALVPVYPITAVTSTPYTIPTTACTGLTTFNSASAIAVSLPPASGPFAGCSFDVQDIGAGAATLTASTLAAPVQSALTTATTGGSLPASTTYYVVITATNASGQTTASNEETLATGAGTGTNTLVASWAAVTGATGYNVWIGTATGAENNYFVASGGSTLTYTITTATGTAGTVPTTNTTASTVNGAASLIVGQNYGCTLSSDNTNWQLSACTAVAPASAGGISPSGSPAQYDTGVFASGTTLAGIAPGASGTCFMSNGTAANPSFQTCPSSTGGTALNLQTFTVSGTWTKPTGSPQITQAICIGGGGGGGSGAVEPSGTEASGGGGGGGASVASALFTTAQLPTTVAVTVSPGGTGGAAKTATSVGANGGQGSSSTFGALLIAYGGGPGQGGATAANTAGGGGGGLAGPGGLNAGGAVGGGAGGSGAAGNSPSSSDAGAGGAGANSGGTNYAGVPAAFGGSGGGSGGAVSSTAVAGVGAAGGANNALGASAGGAVGAAGSPGAVVAGLLAAGTGGGGGGASTTAGGGVGGAGALGGGGGGGGAALNGVGSSGAGGNGGAGECVVVTTY